MKSINLLKYEPEYIEALLYITWRDNVTNYDRSNYYCSISKDVDVSLQQHQNNDWQICKVITVINCGNWAKAAKVEELMRLKGFDTGDFTKQGNEGCWESAFVYLVQKGKPIKKNSYI